MSFRIKQPETSEEFKHYYHLRWKLLRAPWGQAEGSGIDAIEDQCFHLIALDNSDDIIGVARLQFNNRNEAQIRYMAVTEKYQRKAIGGQLMAAMEKHALDSDCHNILLDAREAAVDFYKKQGYQVTAKSYRLFGEIQHFQMSKKLGISS